MVSCAHDSCKTNASFNAKGSKMAAYCKKHAEDGMVNVHHRRCTHGSCTTQPSFNVAGSTTPLYCKQHAEDNMVDVRSRRCVQATCTKFPSFNVEGSKMATYCSEHADASMVHLFCRRCSHHSCGKVASFNVEGAKRAAYCKLHAEYGMVNVVSRRCSHVSCIRFPSWGVLAEGMMGTVCADHKSDLRGHPLVYFEGRCQVAGCGKRSRWGLKGEQPTHCPLHGPLTDGLVCIVGTPSSKRVRRTPPYGAVPDPLFHVKAECSF